MESWCLVKHKSPLLILMMLLIFMVGWIQGIQIEDEKRALLEIKASLHTISNFLNVDSLLPTWVDHGSTGGKHCDWERIKCNTTSGYVTDLCLGNIFSMEDDLFSIYVSNRRRGMIWPLNVSLFLRFKELRRLDLSYNYIGDTFASTGLERLSGLKNLEKLNLSNNFIETNIFPSLSELTSLKILDLSYINGDQRYMTTHDISEFRFPENLEVLDVTWNGYYGTLQMQGFERVSILRKLKILNLGGNYFNESLTSLSAHGSLEVLDLSRNQLSGLFPSQELNHLTNLKKLDLSSNNLNITPSIQGCKSLMRLERLESISIRGNYFNKNIISCLSFLPSLKILDLSDSSSLGRSFPTQELSSLRELTTLDLSYCDLESLTLNGTMSKLQHLTLDGNGFINDDIMMSILSAFPSLRYLSLRDSFLWVEGGRRFPNELPNLPDLEVLLLMGNRFNGTLPIEALASSFPRLEVLDLSWNNFVGGIPSTVKLLSSLKAVSFSRNNLNGSLSNNGLCELKNLEVIDISYNMLNGKLHECFSMLSSLKVFDISANQFTGILLSSLVANLTSLEYVDFSHNKFEGTFSFSSFSNHKKLEFVTFISDNDKFEVETEEPAGWTPMFQLDVLVLSNCNINKPKRSVIPGFLLHQHRLKKLDVSHNSFDGQLPTWLIKNNTMLEFLNLRGNSFDGIFDMSFYTNTSTMWLDISENRITGAIPKEISKSIPSIRHLNLSRNYLDGNIPSSIGELGGLQMLDLSHNELSGEVPAALFTNLSSLTMLKLSNNSLHGEVVSGNLSLGSLVSLHLDGNHFTGRIGNKNNKMGTLPNLRLLDLSNNHFTSLIPDWISNMSVLSTLVVRNNSLGGHFPCVTNSLWFLDLSQNNFLGSIPTCLNVKGLEHFHLSDNKFTGSIPNSFCNLTKVLTLDIGKNYLSGRIPKFIGELSNLRILIFGKNNFSGSIPKELCWLTNANLIDLSGNFLSGSIPRCLQNITGSSYQAIMEYEMSWYYVVSSYTYSNFLHPFLSSKEENFMIEIEDEVMFTTKALSLNYKGDVLNIMFGLDLSCNKLTGDIPKELGFLTQLRALNLSFNLLSGTIPVNFSNFVNMESLDLSSNRLIGNVPSELIKLNSLAFFNVSYNNLSGRLPEMKAQFSTFTETSYEGNPLLCGPPLESDCKNESHVMHPSNEQQTNDKWFDVDTASFYGSCVSTWLVFMLGFVALLHVNSEWRRRWLDFVEECMYTSYYFLYDLVRKPTMLFQRCLVKSG